MPGFIARIELHKADQYDYEKLHHEMKKESFTGVKSYAEKHKHSPVEYVKEGPISLLDVNSATLRAAEKTGRKYSFTVIRKR